MNPRPLYIVAPRPPSGWVERYFDTPAQAGRFLLTEQARRALEIKTDRRERTPAHERN